jgi:hypothetical protein
LGRRFRIFLFRTSQSLHRRGGTQNEYLTVGHLVRGQVDCITLVCGLVAFRELIGMAQLPLGLLRSNHYAGHGPGTVKLLSSHLAIVNDACCFELR